MRSKQRKTYKPTEQPQPSSLSPNPYNHYNNSHNRLDTSRSKNPLIKQSIRQKLSQSKQKNDEVQLLRRQNVELRREIIQLKVHQFYHFDDKKLKQLIMQVQQLRKQLKKLKQDHADMQMQNDFLRRTNAQLRLQMQKDIQNRKKDSFCQDTTKCTLKYGHNRIIQDQISHVSNVSSNHMLQNTTLEEALEHCRTYDHRSYDNRANQTGKSREVDKGNDGLRRNQTHRNNKDLHGRVDQSRIDNKSSRKALIQKCLSPRRPKQLPASQPANEYLLYRRNKQRSPILQRLQ